MPTNDYTGTICRHVCPECGGCDICCPRDHRSMDDKDTTDEQ